MDYSKFIDLYNVTLEDCIMLYEGKGKVAIINDGMLINFMEEENGKSNYSKFYSKKSNHNDWI